MKISVGLGVGSLVVLLGVELSPAADDDDRRIPRLLVPGQKEPEKKEPLRMSGLEIDVEVLGHLATTTLTMTFRNDLDRVLEGELVFPLGDGDVVSRFAMSMEDIDTMREGVVIEKARGRQIFESIVRKQVDPGLLEMTKGNNFRSRVYPIPAKGEKRIVIGYEGTLREADGHYLYQLPLAFADAIDHFKAEVRVVNPEGDPDLGGGLMENLISSVAEKIHTTTMVKTDFRPDREIRLQLPRAAGAKPRVFAHTELRRKKSTTYFHATVPVVKAGGRAKPAPGRIGLLWDASGSADARSRKLELETLDRYLKSLGQVAVTLVVFRDAVEAAETFAVEGGDWSELRARLEGIASDGGTRFAALDLKRYPVDEFLLVSDGLVTFGGGEIGLGEAPVIALNSAATADHSYLRSVARASGGQYVNLATTAPDAAVKTILQQQLRLIEVSGGGERLSEVYPQPGAAVDGESFALAGIVAGEPLELVLSFGYGAEVTQRQTVTVGGDGAAQTPRARRLWAQAKIAELSLDAEANREAITEVAKDESIVTPQTSLIVLDSIDDYVAHRVLPPEAMQEEYFERIEAEELAEEEPLRQHMELVVKRYEELKKWHAEDFPGLEAALVATAEFEVARAKELVRRTGIRIFKKRKLTAESLNPAQELLAKATALAAQRERLGGDEREAITAWRKEAEALNAQLTAFSTDHDQRYPEFARAEIQSEESDDPFAAAGGEGFAGALLRAGSADGVVAESASDDPFGSVEEAERAPGLRRRASAQNAPPALRAPEAPGDADPFGGNTGGAAGAFPVTPATPLDPDREFDPPEIPALFGTASGGLAAAHDHAPSGRPANNAPDGIALKEWNPETPYLKALERAKNDDAYSIYLKERNKNRDSSAFYLDVADHFIEIGHRDLALRVLSNIAEMDLENAPLLRILGHRLLQIGEAALAADVFAEVLRIREEEPQSYRDLALAKSAIGDHKRAAELLWEVVRRPWDDRFQEIDQIALGELNALIASEGEKLRPEGMDERLRGALPVDLRVVLNWDADNTDIDLWVVDPSGETCKYSHNRTVTGGRISKDFTQGYGPEEFVIKTALPGEYTIRAHYYGNRQQTLAGATTIQAKITTDFGRSGEKTKAVTLRLREEEDLVTVGTVRLDG